MNKSEIEDDSAGAIGLPYAESSASLNEENHQTKPIKKYHTQSFRRIWLNKEVNPQFHDWLAPVKENRFRAYCKVCKRLLTAHKYSLTTHCQSVGHLSRMKEVDSAGAAEPKTSPPVHEMKCDENQITPCMPRYYNDGRLIRAIRAVRADRGSITRASRLFKIPYSTLQRHVQYNRSIARHSLKFKKTKENVDLKSVGNLPRLRRCKLAKSEAIVKRDHCANRRNWFNEFIKDCAKPSLFSTFLDTDKDYDRPIDMDHHYSHGHGQTALSGKKLFYRELFSVKSPTRLGADHCRYPGDIDVNVDEDDIGNEPEETDALNELCRSYAPKFLALCQNKSNQHDDSSDVDLDEENSMNAALGRFAAHADATELMDRLFNVIFDSRLCDLSTSQRLDQNNQRENNRRSDSRRFKMILIHLVLKGISFDTVHDFIIENLSVDLIVCYLNILKTIHIEAPDFLSDALANRQKSGSLRSNDIVSPDKSKSALLTEFLDQPIVNELNFLKIAPGNSHDFVLAFISPKFRIMGRKVPPVTTRYDKFRDNFVEHFGGELREIEFPPTERYVKFHQVADDIKNHVVKSFSEIKSSTKKIVILIGWGVSGLLAWRVSNILAPDVLLCFDFPLEAFRHTQEIAPLESCDVKCPALLCIGQLGSDASSLGVKQNVENFSSDKSGLIIVNGVGENLTMSLRRLSTLNLTQKLVDRCVASCAEQFVYDSIAKWSSERETRTNRKFIKKEDNVDAVVEQNGSLAPDEPSGIGRPCVRKTADVLERIITRSPDY